MLIPLKVKQDAINNCSSLSFFFFFQLKIFVEYIQVELCEMTALCFFQSPFVILFHVLKA